MPSTVKLEYARLCLLFVSFPCYQHQIIESKIMEEHLYGPTTPQMFMILYL